VVISQGEIWWADLPAPAGSGPGVEHLANLGNLLKVSRHRIFHEIVGRADASGGQFVQAGFRLGFEVHFHRCESRDVALLCQNNCR
jgi:hypothetical protein